MRKFGLIGYPLSHSFSQKYFTEKFAREGISNCRYDNFPIADISELKNIISSNPDLEGLNVTIPYKLQVISFLDESKNLPISACNCIKISSGKLSGFNTDVTGFELSLKTRLKANHRKALILGKGGASEAVRFVLGRLGIEFIQVSRQPSSGELAYDQVTVKIIRDHLLIINCTPLGMYPNIESFPPIPYEPLGGNHLLFDLIYNPAKTAFLQKGEERGAAIQNGLEMLVIQAEESWKIWNQV
jgi:shikimate dehydrogenase